MEIEMLKYDEMERGEASLELDGRRNEAVETLWQCKRVCVRACVCERERETERESLKLANGKEGEHVEKDGGF